MPTAAQYDFNALVQSAVVASVDPVRGPTTGGTLVTLIGSLFAGDATVRLVGRDRAGALTPEPAQVCEWRTAYFPGVTCNDTVVR